MKSKVCALKVACFLMIAPCGCDYAMKEGPLLRNNLKQPVDVTVWHRDGVVFPAGSPVAPGSVMFLGRYYDSAKKVKIETENGLIYDFDIDNSRKGELISHAPSCLWIVTPNGVVTGSIPNSH